MPCRIAVDGYALADASADRGVGTVLKRLLAGLAVDPDLALEVLVPRPTTLPEGVVARPVTRRARRPRLAHVEHEVRLPFDLRGVDADVIFSPAQHPPAFARAPVVQLLHDLLPLERPNPMASWDAARWRRAARALRRAERIATPSESSAAQGVRHLGLDRSRIEVVPLGIDERFSPGPAPDGDDPPYILHVGAFGPYKGHTEAADVAALVADAGLPHVMKFVGAGDEWMLARVAEIVAASPRPDRIEHVGFVEDLVPAYRGAAVVVVSSRGEGFGLPALEAMACGRPVVSFDNTSLPEVVGDAGVLVPDGDVRAMADAVVELLRDRRRAEELGAAGRERSLGFRWETVVARYREILLGAAR